MNSDYLIQFKEIKCLSISELTELLLQKKGLPVSDLKVAQLSFYKGTPIYSGNGVYLFKTEDRVMYVGNCTARNFVERIPGHFDLRAGGWFNSLLKAVVKKKYNETVSDTTLIKAATEAIDTFELILINFSNAEFYPNGIKDKKTVNQLENLLRITLQPLNTFKHKKVPKNINTVKEYLGM